MKIEINLKIILALIFYFIFDNIKIYLIFMEFILIHEFAHLISGIALGGVPKKMTISIFGVSLEFYSYGKNKTIHRILFFVIGPIINLIIGFLCSRLMKNSEFKDIIVQTNYAIGIFNLIPILPLDGGKILKEILRLCVGVDKSNVLVMIISKTVLVIFTLIYSVLILKVKSIMILFLLMYLWYLYIIEEKKFYLYEKTRRAIKNII